MAMNQTFVPPAGISNNVRLSSVIKNNFWIQVSYKGRNGNWAYMTRFSGKKTWTVAAAYEGEYKGRVVGVDLKRAEAILTACQHCE